MKSNIALTFTRFLKELDAKVTKTSAMEYIESHPEEGSLLAITEGLEHWNIETASIRITEEQMVEMPTPFITFFKRNGGTFGVVRSFKDGILEWYDTNRGIVKQSWSEFQQDWSGVVLLAEINKKSGEKNFKDKVRKELLSKIRVPMGLTLLALVLLGLFILTPSFGLIGNIIFFLKSTGVILSILLLAKGLGTDNELVNKLCKVGSKVSCQSILDSPYAKLTSWLTLSDVGFIYFSTTLILMLFSEGVLFHFYSLHLIMSFISIPFIIFSIYFQARIAKVWCSLCLAVISILFIESILIIFFFQQFFFFPTGFLISLAISLFIPVSLLLLFKIEIVKSIEKDRLKLALRRLKSNPLIIETLLASEREMPPIYDSMGVVVIGNEDACNIVSIVSNPLCNPCAKMHQRIQYILENNRNIKCEIIFTTNNDVQDIGNKVVRKILSLPRRSQREAIDKWFDGNNRNFEAWNEDYNCFEEKLSSEGFRREQRKWNDLAEIKSTPTIYFNRRKLPQILSIEDLDNITR